jgi:hypothetical protein
MSRIQLHRLVLQNLLQLTVLLELLSSVEVLHQEIVQLVVSDQEI